MIRPIRPLGASFTSSAGRSPISKDDRYSRICGSRLQSELLFGIGLRPYRCTFTLALPFGSPSTPSYCCDPIVLTCCVAERPLAKPANFGLQAAFWPPFHLRRSRYRTPRFSPFLNPVEKQGGEKAGHGERKVDVFGFRPSMLPFYYSKYLKSCNIFKPFLTRPAYKEGTMFVE